jgi:hypothetical protein
LSLSGIGVKGVKGGALNQTKTFDFKGLDMSGTDDSNELERARQEDQIDLFEDSIQDTLIQPQACLSSGEQSAESDNMIPTH